jgi:hypothetical protein
MIDPLHFAIAAVPLAAYFLLLGFLNSRRRPFLTSGGCDMMAFGVALSGLIFVGPIELFRPEAATRSFGNYIWLFLLGVYWLWLLLLMLLARPRLVIYNIAAEELHPVLAELAPRLDAAARWAGNQLSLPTLSVQLHIDRLDLMRNVSLVSSGGQQSIEGWRRLSHELSRALRKGRGRMNPRSIGFFAVAIALFSASISHLLLHSSGLQRALGEIFAY